MSLTRLIYLFALLLAFPVVGFGQVIPVAPNLMLDIGSRSIATRIISNSLKFDNQGNIYVAGVFQNDIDFDPSPAYKVELAAARDAFVAKYTAAGALVWITQLNGSGVHDASMDIDRNGNITVIGETAPGYIPQQISPPVTGGRGVFVWHINNDGNTLWKRFIVGTNNGLFTSLRHKVGSVTSDDAGNVIVVCPFRGTTYVDGYITSKGTTDGLVIKYDPNGNVIWKFNLGTTGGNDNSVLGVAVDKDNSIVIAGYNSGAVNYNPLGAAVNSSLGNCMFLAKYTQQGILQWLKTIDGAPANYNLQLALEGKENICITGVYSNPITFTGGSTLNRIGYQDMFVAKYSSGGTLLYNKCIGGELAFVLNQGLVVGPDKSLYISGSFNGNVDFDPSASSAEQNSNGSSNFFLAKYDDNANYNWAFGVNINSGRILNMFYSEVVTDVGARAVNVNANNEIFLTGGFSGTVNFDATGCGASYMTSQGSIDMFIVSYVPKTLMPIINNTIAAPAETSVCPGIDPSIITGSVPTGNVYTYQWQQSLNNTTFTDIAGAVAKDFDPPVITATTYYRRRLVSSVCGAPNISNVVTITLLKSATGNTIYTPVVNSFCTAGNAGLIVGTTPVAVGTFDYQWQQSTDNVTFTDISGATARDYDPPAISATTYYRRVVNNAPCSIGMLSDAVTIAIVPVPVPTVSAEQTICFGDGATLNATGGTRYSWSPATGLSALDVASPRATPAITTTYSVTVFNGDCSNTLTVKVNVINRPAVNAGADKDVMNGDMIQLNPQISAVQGATYSWTPNTYLDNPNIANPTASPSKNITYRLTVTSALGCHTVSDEVTITVHEKMVIPNTFTPNGDGINDLLIIEGLNAYQKSVFTVFNRSGQPVFKSQAYPKPWDGTHNGKSLPMGTYYYVIELGGNQKSISGYVNLMK